MKDVRFLHDVSPATEPAAQGGPGWEVRTRRGEPLIAVSEMKLGGAHNAANALAALALGEALELPLAVMLAELRSFAGLPHRSQWVADVNGVSYINDSKGTNVGATLAAVLGTAAPVVLIAGGEGKNQDFSPIQALRGKAKAAGNLNLTMQLRVAQPSGDIITLQPGNPLVVWVPQYNPAVVYGVPIQTPGYKAENVPANGTIASAGPKKPPPAGASRIDSMGLRVGRCGRITSLPMECR